MDKDKLISQMKDLLRRSKDALELEYGEENELVSDIKIVLAKNISLNPDVSGSISIADIQMLKNALMVIKNWSEEDEDEWSDPGEFAAHTLREWKRRYEASENDR